jgi:hypothetical protein
MLAKRGMKRVRRLRYMCDLALLYVCPHATPCVSSSYCMSPHTVALCMCPQEQGVEVAMRLLFGGEGEGVVEGASGRFYAMSRKDRQVLLNHPGIDKQPGS